MPPNAQTLDTSMVPVGFPASLNVTSASALVAPSQKTVKSERNFTNVFLILSPFKKKI